MLRLYVICRRPRAQFPPLDRAAGSRGTCVRHYGTHYGRILFSAFLPDSSILQRQEETNAGTKTRSYSSSHTTTVFPCASPPGLLGSLDQQPQLNVSACFDVSALSWRRSYSSHGRDNRIPAALHVSVAYIRRDTCSHEIKTDQTSKYTADAVRIPAIMLSFPQSFIAALLLFLGLFDLSLASSVSTYSQAACFTALTSKKPSSVKTNIQAATLFFERCAETTTTPTATFRPSPTTVTSVSTSTSSRIISRPLREHALTAEQ